MISKLDYRKIPATDDRAHGVQAELCDSEIAHERLMKTCRFNPVAILAVIIITNLCTWLVSRRGLAGEMDLTPWAELKRDTPTKYQRASPFVSMNRTESLRQWSRISIDSGVVALPPEIMEATGLPLVQTFPWDRSRGLFILHGHHQLHCVRAIHIAVMEYHYGIEQSRKLEHIMHCLDALRQDVICNADDTPRYPYPDRTGHSVSDGQTLMCRSWDKLESWAQEYNACYAYINQTAEIPNLERFKYCPEGSPYSEDVKERYGNVPTYEELDLEEWSYKDSFDKLLEAEEAIATSGE